MGGASPFSVLKMDETLSRLAGSATALTNSVPVDLEVDAPGEAEVVVSGVQIAPRGELVDVNVTLSRAAKYAAYALTGPDRLVMEITGARLGDGIQRAYESGPVQRLRARNERGQSILVFDLNDPAHIKSTELVTTAAAPLLRVSLTMSPVAAESELLTTSEPSANANATKPVVVTRDRAAGMEIRPSSDDHLADRLYDDGAELCRNGNLAAGLAKLAEVLVREPGHVKGRQLLATELMRQGDTRQAASMLDAGLEKYPHIWQWAQLRAQLAINAGDTDHALAVLTKAPPPLAEQAEYHGLLAAVQQRAGRHDAAVVTYHAILGQRPERGIWWLGLGISLQALERSREAGFAFMRALEDKSLTPELRSFVQGRMNSLPPGGKT